MTYKLTSYTDWTCDACGYMQRSENDDGYDGPPAEWKTYGVVNITYHSNCGTYERIGTLVHICPTCAKSDADGVARFGLITNAICIAALNGLLPEKKDT